MLIQKIIADFDQESAPYKQTDLGGAIVQLRAGVREAFLPETFNLKLETVVMVSPVGFNPQVSSYQTILPSGHKHKNEIEVEVVENPNRTATHQVKLIKESSCSIYGYGESRQFSTEELSIFSGLW